MVARLVARIRLVLRLITGIIGRAGTPGWLAIAGVCALIIAAGGGRLVLAIVPVASAAEGGLSEIRQLPLGQLVQEESSELDDLRRRVAKVSADVRPASQSMRWVGRFASAFSWLPVVRQEMTAWAAQMERVQQDLNAASALLDSSSRLFEISSGTHAALLSGGAGASIPQLQAQVRDLESSFTASLEAAESAHLVGQSVSVGLQAPRIRSSAALLGELEDRMLTAASLGRGVSSLLGELLELADGARPLMGRFIGNGPESETWTNDSLNGALARVNEHALSAGRKADEVAALLPATGEFERLESQLTTLDQLLAVLQAASRASMVSLSAAEHARQAVQDSNGGLLDGGGGIIEIFDAFVQRRDEIASVIVELGDAQRVLADLASNGDGLSAGRGLSDISRFVTDLRAGLQLVNAIAPMGSALLGADGAQRYLVLGQSADELRATGGFVSSIWLVTFEAGRLASVRYHDAVRVDAWDRLTLYPRAPLGLEEHMNARVWLLRDISWDPDFPTTARTAEDMYRIGQRMDVDGVVAINQWTLLRWIEALGEISSPDGGAPVTPRNLLSVLEDGTDRHGRAYMDLVLQGVLDKMTQSVSVPTLLRLASGVHDTLRQRDMLIFFDDEELQAVMSQLGWDGSVRQGSMDYLFVVDSNVGWSKVDRNIQRDVSYVVDLSREGRPRASLTLGYSNHSGPGSPGCEPQWLNRGTEYGQLKNACYWNFIRVYMPQGARLLSSTPLPLPEYSVSVEIGRGVPGYNTGDIRASHNKVVFSGLTTLGAGDRNEIDLAYDLPASVLRREGDSLVYELLVQKQPGVRERGVSVELALPKGYRFASSSVSPVLRDGSRLRFSFALTQDISLKVEFVEDADDSR